VTLCRKIIRLVERTFKLKIKVIWHILEVEVADRVNGWCASDFGYNAKDEKIYEPQIILSGKRIPIHPAMTRYLISHEYGHAVESYLREVMLGDADKIGEFRDMYSKVRGLKSIPGDYTATSWASSPGEIFANDFRILACGLEAEFWPHPSVAHPHKSKPAQKFWDEVMKGGIK